MADNKVMYIKVVYYVLATLGGDADKIYPHANL